MKTRYHEQCAEAAREGRGKDVCADCWEEAAYMLNYTTDAAGVAAYIADHAAETVPGA